MKKILEKKWGKMPKFTQVIDFFCGILDILLSWRNISQFRGFSEKICVCPSLPLVLKWIDALVDNAPMHI